MMIFPVLEKCTDGGFFQPEIPRNALQVDIKAKQRTEALRSNIINSHMQTRKRERRTQITILTAQDNDHLGSYSMISILIRRQNVGQEPLLACFLISQLVCFSFLKNKIKYAYVLDVFESASSIILDLQIITQYGKMHTKKKDDTNDAIVMQSTISFNYHINHVFQDLAQQVRVSVPFALWPYRDFPPKP